jgi:hypothetical protein
VKNYFIRLLPRVVDTKPLQPHVFCPVRSKLSPVAAYRSQSVFSKIPLGHHPFLQHLRRPAGKQAFVRRLLQYYVDVRLLSSVHARIMATDLPWPTRLIYPRTGTVEISRFSSIERPRMLRVSDSAGPMQDWLIHALHRVAFPTKSRGRHPEWVISELNTWPAFPLSTLRRPLAGSRRMTRGHDGAAPPFM